MTVNKATDTFAIPGMKELQAETEGSPDVLIAVLDGPVELSLLPKYFYLLNPAGFNL